MAHSGSTLSCISWNIHRGRGEDGIVDPARTVRVLFEEVCNAGTDVLVLQEADDECPPHDGFLDIDLIETQTGLRYAHRDKRHRWAEGSQGFLGVMCFLRPSIEVEAVALIDLPGHCHRGAVCLDLRKEGVAFRLITTHLSLSQVLRAAQMRVLGQFLFRQSPRPTILCGDLNEWRPWGGLAFSKLILGMQFAGPAVPTFPVRRPFLPLDRFLGAGGARVTQASVSDGEGIRMASDHRPLTAQIVF